MGKVRQVEYRFQHFNRELLRDELTFGAGKDPGWQIPDFELPTTDGGRVRKRDFMGRRPLLVSCASITDPMAASAGPVLRKLYREFGDRVAFMTLYVREVHPGDHIKQPPTFDWKMRHAKWYRERDAIPWTVAVDDLEGTVHRALGGNANAAFIMEPNGNVAFRTLWSNDEKVLRHALRAVADGRADHPFEEERRVVPLVLGLAHLDEVVRAAGREAVADVRSETPFIFGAAEVAWVLRSLTPRGRVVLLACGLIAMGVLFGGSRLARRRMERLP